MTTLDGESIDTVRVGDRCRADGVRFEIFALRGPEGWLPRWGKPVVVPLTDERVVARCFALPGEEAAASRLDGADVQNAWAMLPGVWIERPVTELRDVEPR
jgi:hypothetical protein